MCYFPYPIVPKFTVSPIYTEKQFFVSGSNQLFSRANKPQQKTYKANLKKKKVEGAIKEVRTDRNSKELEVLTYKDFRNVKETALLPGCPIRTVYRLIQDGSLKAVNLSQRLIQVNKKSLNSIIPQA